MSSWGYVKSGNDIRVSCLGYDIYVDPTQVENHKCAGATINCV